jgi:molybdate transport system substrate-binding protein
MRLALAPRRPRRTGRPLSDALLAVLLACMLGACGDGAASPPLRVFASASLTEAFTVLGHAWAESRDVARPQLHFAGTPQLVLQLREGAHADVLATADPRQMEHAVALGLVSGEPRRFARNRLAIAFAPGNPHAIATLADLARTDLLVAWCGPEVPAGRYARQALHAADVEAQSCSDEPSVKAVVTKIALGELDAGVVYVTDVQAAAGRVDGVPVTVGPSPRYPVARLADARDTELADDFLTFVLSREGAAILRDHGFRAP